MTDPIARTVAFTGHRTCRSEAIAPLRQTIEALYAEGFRRFLSGMALGFDLTAAEQVLACRSAHPDIELVAVIPFAAQAERFPARERQRYGRILTEADEVVCLASHYHAGCYAVRNDYLADHAACLAAWYDGSPGGTRYTVRRAEQRQRRILNLHPAGPQFPAAPPSLFDL